jgi:hypothetical protein
MPPSAYTELFCANDNIVMGKITQQRMTRFIIRGCIYFVR